MPRSAPIDLFILLFTLTSCSDAIPGTETNSSETSSTITETTSNSSSSESTTLTSCPTGTWATSAIDAEAWVTTRPAIAISGDTRYIAYFDSSSYELHLWQNGSPTVTIDSISLNTSPGLAIAPDGSIHVSYVNTLNLWHAQCNPSTNDCSANWSPERVSSARAYGETDLAIADTVHIANATYQDESGYETRQIEHHRLTEEGTWQQNIVGLGEGPPQFAIDTQQQRLHLTYADVKATLQGPFHAVTEDSSSWTTEGPLTEYSVTDTTIVFEDFGSTALYYSTSDGIFRIKKMDEGWSTPSKIVEEDVLFLRAITSGNLVYLVYVSQFPYELHFICADIGAGLLENTVIEETSYPPAITTDSKGYPVIAFSNENGNLQIAEISH